MAIHDVHMVRHFVIGHPGLAKALPLHIFAVVFAQRHSRVDHALAASLPYHYEDLSAQEMRPLLLDSLLQQAPPIGSLPFLAPSPLEMPHA